VKGTENAAHPFTHHSSLFYTHSLFAFSFSFILLSFFPFFFLFFSFSTAMGIRCIDGVVLGVEKSMISKLLLDSSNKRIFTTDLHSGLALSGLAADARQLVNKARSEAAEYRNMYGSEIPGQVLADRVALVIKIKEN
jgi:hypothetical protein